MSGLPKRSFRVFSAIWGALLVGVLAFGWMIWKMSPETDWEPAIYQMLQILGLGVAIWFCAYFAMRWLEERS